MSQALSGDDVIGKVFVRFQNRRLHAAFVVQVNVNRSLREVCPVRMPISTPFGSLCYPPGGSVIDYLAGAITVLAQFCRDW
jgi:hypothetical protein